MTSSGGRHDTSAQNGLFYRLLVTGVRCAFGYHDEIVSTNDISLLYNSLTGWSRDQVKGGEQRVESAGESVEESGDAGSSKYKPDQQTGCKEAEEEQDEVDGTLPAFGPKRACVALQTEEHDVEQCLGDIPQHVDEELVTDGPSAEASDEETTMTVQQSHPDLNGGCTNVYIQKIVLGDGTPLQIGKGNIIHYLHNNSNTTTNNRGDEEESCESGEDSSELDTSCELSEDISLVTQPAASQAGPSTCQQEVTKRAQTANFARAKQSKQSCCHSKTEPSDTLTRSCDINNDNRIRRDTSSHRVHEIVTQTEDLASAESRVLGRCPLGARLVDDIVVDDHWTSDEDKTEEFFFPLTNMFVDVDEEMFVGREDEFKQLDKQLLKKRVAGVSGMGGSGKTTFACLYAYRHKKRYKNGIFFVDASNINTLPLNFAQLAGHQLLNLVRCPDEDVPRSIKLVSRWLEKNSNYLLIFDAADGVKTMEEIGKQRPVGNFRYIPPRQTLRGHVLVTSRLPEHQFETIQVLRPVVLGDLGMHDTCEFLKRRVYGDVELDEDERKAQETLILEYLPGKLPLNLEQTASFIRRQKRTFTEYLEEVLVNKQRKNYNPLEPASFGDNRKTIDDAFTANFDAVAEESQAAAALLNMAALCHSRNIPYALFSVGALALTHTDVDTEGNIPELIDYLIENSPVLQELELGQSGVFSSAASAGKLALLQLLAVPEESQLVKYKRGGNEFTVHEVIQEQLQKRMKEKTEMVPALMALGAILLYMLRSDDVPLNKKNLFLSHAEKCTANMVRYGPVGSHSYHSSDLDMDGEEAEFQPELTFTDLYLKLRIKTAFVFAWLGSFPTAAEIIAELELKMPHDGADHLKVGLLSLKARLHVWQHQPAEALKHGRQGLELFKNSEQLANRSNVDKLIEYAFLHKSCAHALLTQYETATSDVTLHLSEAKQAFETITRSSSTNYKEEYAHLLMLHGLLHRNVAERCPQNDQGRRLAEFQLSREWLIKAIVAMDATNYVIETCKVHLCMVEVELGWKTPEDAIQELSSCRQALDIKLGSHHRYTAWVLGKMACLLQEIGCVEEALEKTQESLTIQETVYGSDSGKVQMGQTRLFEGQALVCLRRYREASVTLEKAERLLEDTPKNPAYTKVRNLLREVRELAELDFLEAGYSFDLQTSLQYSPNQLTSPHPGYLPNRLTLPLLGYSSHQLTSPQPGYSPNRSTSSQLGYSPDRLPSLQPGYSQIRLTSPQAEYSQNQPNISSYCDNRLWGQNSTGPQQWLQSRSTVCSTSDQNKNSIAAACDIPSSTAPYSVAANVMAYDAIPYMSHNGVTPKSRQSQRKPAVHDEFAGLSLDGSKSNNSKLVGMSMEDAVSGPSLPRHFKHIHPAL